MASRKLIKVEKGIYKRGKTFWTVFFRNGKVVRRSLGTDLISVARNKVKKLRGEMADGKAPTVLLQNIKMGALLNEFVQDREVNGGIDSRKDAGYRVKHLEPFFAHRRAIAVTGATINEYITHRRGEGAADPTINRELAALRRAFNLGVGNRKVDKSMVPEIKALKENAPKRGFLDPEVFEIFALELCARAPELEGVVRFGYETGWRMEEVLGLTWDMVDLYGGRMVVPASQTKNREEHRMQIGEGIRRILEAQEQVKNGPYVFHRDGHKIRDFRGVWSYVCRETGLGYGYALKGAYVEEQTAKGLPPGPVFHDFRRSAVRNMERAGVPRKVAMQITGHKTESVYSRYDIIDDQDQIEAQKKVAQYRAERAQLTPKQTPQADKGEALDQSVMLLMLLSAQNKKVNSK